MRHQPPLHEQLTAIEAEIDERHRLAVSFGERTQVTTLGGWERVPHLKGQDGARDRMRGHNRRLPGQVVELLPQPNRHHRRALAALVRRRWRVRAAMMAAQARAAQRKRAAESAA